MPLLKSLTKKSMSRPNFSLPSKVRSSELSMHVLFVVLFFFQQNFSQPSPKIAKVEVLNRTWVENTYKNGDLDAVKFRLQGILKSRQTLSRSDSIFVYKYVSVVTAADAENKHIAKDYMYKLLSIQPNVDIIDLYVSESITQLFQDVKKEFHARMAYVSQKDTIENSNSKPIGLRPKEKPHASKPKNGNNSLVPSKSYAIWYWTAAGLAVTGSAIGIYLWSNSKPKQVPISN
jgi:hypothetical protein